MTVPLVFYAITFKDYNKTYWLLDISDDNMTAKVMIFWKSKFYSGAFFWCERETPRSIS